MLAIEHLIHPSDIVCTSPLQHEIDHTCFDYFDKYGFELNQAEQAYYTANEFAINTGFLNKSAWMTNWLYIDTALDQSRFFIGHAFCSYRCNYRGEAETQIKSYAKHHVHAKQLLQIRPKWGFDFSINAVAPTGEIFELLHIEYSTYFYKEFNTQRSSVEEKLLSTNWHDAADQIWDRKLEWVALDDHKQDDWKSKLLLDWEFSKHTKKALML